ncbi:sigma-70 family RNA polymerase sigma factor [Planococcus sp. N028]|uniref:Sigma-70 family RNA polymerase sigma factor n=1 Tax=Planococcus shixiaomingii TaxID=3058393 RepID=A0ABT8N4I8_9BACL|nr:sigma-70 family RNA polymerase sigma factor [Planococcus sp. N028]MDN7242799.1 sigma-70 family RNA polymerase sigma factor [Planococcus sp. N028]
MQHDEEMIKAAIQGDRLALQQLLKLEKEKLYRMAFTYVKNEEEALEIFQQTVLQAIESVHQVKKPQYFSTWLARIGINKALAVLKKKKKLVVMEEIKERRAEADSVDIAQQLDVATALGLLPDKYKTVLMLRFYQDFTVKQIANVMDCPEGTVKTALHRGLTMLKKDLKGVYADEGQRDFN